MNSVGRFVHYEMSPDWRGIDSVLGDVRVDIRLLEGYIQGVGLLVRTLSEHHMTAVAHAAGLLTGASQAFPLKRPTTLWSLLWRIMSAG